jgi:hypothetical protein
MHDLCVRACYHDAQQNGNKQTNFFENVERLKYSEAKVTNQNWIPK